MSLTKSILHSLHDTSGEVLFQFFKSQIQLYLNLYRNFNMIKATSEERCLEMCGNKSTSSDGLLLLECTWILKNSYYYFLSVTNDEALLVLSTSQCWFLTRSHYRKAHLLSHVNQVWALRPGFITHLFWAKRVNETDEDLKTMRCCGYWTWTSVFLGWMMGKGKVLWNLSSQHHDG